MLANLMRLDMADYSAMRCLDQSHPENSFHDSFHVRIHNTIKSGRGLKIFFSVAFWSSGSPGVALLRLWVRRTAGVDHRLLHRSGGALTSINGRQPNRHFLRPSPRPMHPHR